MHRKETVNIKNLAQKMAFIMVGIVLIQMLSLGNSINSSINRIGISPSVPISNNPRAAQNPEFVPVLPSETDFNIEEFSDKLSPILEQIGGFPSKNVDLEATYFAIKLLGLIGNESIYSIEEMYQFLIGLFDSNNNLTDQELISVESYFYIAKSLELMGLSLPVENQEAIVEYLQSCVLDDSLFKPSEVSVTASLESTYQALSIIETFIGLGEISINIEDFLQVNSTFEILLTQYFNNALTDINFALFAKDDQHRFEDTYYAVQILNIIEKLYDQTTIFHKLDLEIEIGTKSEGDTENLWKSDDATMKVESDSQLANITVDFSWDNLLKTHSSGEPEIYLQFLENETTSLDNVTLEISIWNEEQAQWEQISTITNLSSTLDDGLLINGIDEITFQDYILQGEGTNPEIAEYAKVQFYFTGTDDFEIALDELGMSLFCFDKEVLLQAIFDHHSNNRFSTESLLENYYALALLDFFNSVNEIELTSYQSLSNYVSYFKQESKGYCDMNYEIFDSMKATYGAAFIHNIAEQLTIEEVEKLEQYAQAWHLLNEGFGSYAIISLGSTYRSVNFLNLTGELTSAIQLKVLEYVKLCDSDISSNYYHDSTDEGSLLSDSYYAIQLKRLCNETYDLSQDNAMISDLIESQSPVGYFLSENNLQATYFAVELIQQAGRLDDIVFKDELNDYILDAQLYYGGFLNSPYESEAWVSATCYAILLAEILDLKESMRLTEENNLMGVIEYVKTHQSGIDGGFFEEDMGLLENETSISSNQITYLVSDAISGIQEFVNVNGTGLSDFVINQISDFNEFIEADKNSTQIIEFSTTAQNLIYVYQAYDALKAVRLEIEIFMARATSIPGKNVELTINITNFDGMMIEGCDIYLITDIEDAQIGFQARDHQNGQYTALLPNYLQAGHYKIKIYCEHDDYFDFTMIYDLDIRDPVDLDRLGTLDHKWVIFDPFFELRLPIFNEINQEFIENASVYMLDLDGNIILNFSANDEDEYYSAFLDGNGWWAHSNEYELVIEAEGIRTEIISMEISIFPLSMLIYGITCTVLGAYILYKKSPKARIAMDNIGKKLQSWSSNKLGTLNRKFSTKEDIKTKEKTEKDSSDVHKILERASERKTFESESPMEQKSLEDQVLSLRDTLGEEIYQEFEDFDLPDRVRILKSVEKLGLQKTKEQHNKEELR